MGKQAAHLQRAADLGAPRRLGLLSPVVRLLVALVLCGLASGSGVARADPAVQLEAAGGFDGYYRAGQWVPFVVTLSNQGDEVRGEVRVEWTAAGGSVAAAASPVELPAGSRKRLFLFAPIAGSPPLVTVKLVAGDQTLAEAPVRLRMVQPEEGLIGLVTTDPRTFEFFGLLRPGGKNRRLVPVRLSPADLPPKAAALRSFDLLAFGVVSTSDLSADQRAALDRWVAEGGTLVLGGGPATARVLDGLPELAPVRPAGTLTLNELPALEAFGRASLRLTGPTVVGVGQPVDGAAVLLEQDGLPLIVERQYGLGRVVFLAVDPTVEALRLWIPGWTSLWPVVFEPATAFPPDPAATESAFASLVADIPSVRLPPPLFLGGFLLAYILTVGPLTYVVLWRLDRREWAWAVIPVLTLAFSAGAYLVAYEFKGGQVIVNSLTVVMVGPDGNASADAYFSLFSPVRRDYDVFVSGRPLPRLVGLTRAPLEAPGRPAYIGEPGGFRDIVVNAWDLQAFGFREVELGPVGLEAEVAVSGGRLTVRVTNGTDADFRETLFIVGDRAYRLGPIGRGESRWFDLGTAPGEPLGQLTSFQPQAGQGLDWRRVIGPLLADSRLGRGGAWVVGWSDSRPFRVDIGGGFVSGGLTAWVTPVGLRVDGPGFELPAGFCRQEVTAWDGRAAPVAWSPAGINLLDGTYFVRCQFPAAAVGGGLKVGGLWLEYQAAAAGGQQVTMQLFDWDRRQWVFLGQPRNGRTEIQNPGSYVGPGGRVYFQLRVAGGAQLERLNFGLKAVAK